MRLGLMKILMFGAGGQLGSSLYQSQYLSNFDMFVFNKNEADITDLKLLSGIFETIRPDIVINAAAYTNVKEAETNIKIAESVNINGPNHLPK